MSKKYYQKMVDYTLPNKKFKKFNNKPISLSFVNKLLTKFNEVVYNDLTNCFYKIGKRVDSDQLFLHEYSHLGRPNVQPFYPITEGFEKSNWYRAKEVIKKEKGIKCRSCGSLHYDQSISHFCSVCIVQCPPKYKKYVERLKKYQASKTEKFVARCNRCTQCKKKRKFEGFKKCSDCLFQNKLAQTKEEAIKDLVLAVKGEDVTNITTEVWNVTDVHHTISKITMTLKDHATIIFQCPDNKYDYTKLININNFF